MNLNCLKDIISNGLAIHIDLTDNKSWNLNTGLTSVSLTKWKNAYSDNLNLRDFGLTGFDNGRTNIMWSGITLAPDDTKLKLYRVGYNDVINPTSTQYSGFSATTIHDGYEISAVTTGDSGNYFMLNGGYLQGFFNLEGFNHKLLPTRFGTGITIETLVNLLPNSSGIFYMMGVRAEDKYNPHYDGELVTGKTKTGGVNLMGIPHYLTREQVSTKYMFEGINTTLNNYLDSIQEIEQYKSAFRVVEDAKETVLKQSEQIENIKNNVIAFEITEDRRLGYKYIDENGLVKSDSSTNQISNTGFTLISITYTPNTDYISEHDLLCGERRMGDLRFFINGRQFWKIKEFSEFFFKALVNDKEKQIGVPYSISWGGGSFGLKHSWHYDKQTYDLYDSGSTEQINTNFFIQPNPIATECNPNPSEDYLPGLRLFAESDRFVETDDCDGVETPKTVMGIEYTGDTIQDFYVKFTQPISVLSNRDYVVNMSLYNEGIFNKGNISIVAFSHDSDIHVLNEVIYSYPSINSDENFKLKGLKPFPYEYQYVSDGVKYYGGTGIPITDLKSNIYGHDLKYFSEYDVDAIITGLNTWKDIEFSFRIQDDLDKEYAHIGILIESDTYVSGKTLYIKDFTYTAADVLVQDQKKENLLIEQNFDSSFIGGIQKLRVYDTALDSSQIMHNALIESKNYLFNVNNGGRIINVDIPKKIIEPTPPPIIIKDVAVFYGVSSTYPVPDQTLVDNANTINLSRSQADGNIEINFGINVGEYLWMAIPSDNVEKTTWFVSSNNKGSIGSSTDLFVRVEDVEINSPTSAWTNKSYDFYITQYPTDTNGNNFIFKI
ncbi:MAG: hypothetical protein ACOC22_00295 [bacterium]